MRMSVVISEPHLVRPAGAGLQRQTGLTRSGFLLAASCSLLMIFPWRVAGAPDSSPAQATEEQSKISAGSGRTQSGHPGGNPPKPIDTDPNSDEASAQSPNENVVKTVARPLRANMTVTLLKP